MNSLKELSDTWKRAGLQKGDILLIHSDISRLYLHYKRQDPNFRPFTILESLLNVVDDGMIFFPTFNFDFPEGKAPYDILHSPSQMGTLTELARQTFGRCNGHPAHSFACSQKHRFIDNFEGFSLTSPFAETLILGGKIAVLDLEENRSMTFYHFVENFWKVYYRYSKTFTNQYIDGEGHSQEKTYEMFVRYPHITTQVNPMGEILWNKHIWKGDRPHHNSGFRIAHAEAIYQETTKIIQSHNCLNTLFQLNDSNGQPKGNSTYDLFHQLDGSIDSTL